MYKAGYRHPKGLFFLFLTEMGERFGFYALQAILVLYMAQSLRFNDEKTYMLYGVFGSLAYFTPVLGGWVADRWLGFKYCILIGGVFLVAGYLLSSIPDEKFFFGGLGAVIVGNGFFKPCISSLVGELYAHDDEHRESGFTIFYMSINLGALAIPLFIGDLVNRFGWKWGFWLAAIGISAGMIVFGLGRARLSRVGNIPTHSPLARNKDGAPRCDKQAGMDRNLIRSPNKASVKSCAHSPVESGEKTFDAMNPAFKGRASDLSLSYFSRALFWLGTTVSLAAILTGFIFYYPKQIDILLVIMILLTAVYLIRVVLRQPRASKNRLFACLVLMLISVVFWAFYSQMFTSLMLFAMRNMKKEMLGFSINAEFTQFFNPFFIVCFSPVISWIWHWLSQRRINPSTPVKFFIGILSLSLGFLFLSGILAWFCSDGICSPWWLAGSYLFLTFGELFVAPIGLAMVTRLAPAHLAGLMMGAWFLSISVGYLAGSFLAMLTDAPSNISPTASIGIYSHAFQLYGILAMSAAIACFCLVPWLTRVRQM
jgi:POT family proton-dependent oligopeptide transporter